MSSPDDAGSSRTERALGPRDGSRHLVLPAAFAVAAAFACHWLLWRSWGGFVGGLDDTSLLFADFVRHYYPTAREVLRTGAPTSGYFYPVGFAVMLVPFGLVPLPVSMWLWGAVQLVTAALLAIVAGRCLSRQGRGFPLLHLVLFLLCLPVLSNFKWGQVSTLAILCGVAALERYQSGRKVQAGVVLALGTAIKYYPGLFAIYFLLKRDVRALAAFAAATLLLAVGLPWATLGPARSEQFRRTVQARVVEARRGLFRDINSQYIASVVYRQTARGAKEISPLQRTVINTPQARMEALREQMLGPERPGPVWQVLRWIGYVLFAAHMGLLLALVRMRVPEEAALSLVLLYASIPLIIETSWPHYFVWLPFCQAALFAAFRGRQRWARVSGWSMLGLSMLLSSVLFFRLLGDWRPYSRWGMPFVADALVLVAVYVLLFALRSGRGSGLPAGLESARGQS